MEGKIDADGCTYTRIRRKTCNTVEDPETRKPILRCERLEQLLRHCPGRKPEVVESKREETEEDVPSEEEGDHQHSLGSSSGNPLSRFSEALEEHLSGEIEGFMRAAEEMANELFGNFGIFKHGERERGSDEERFHRRAPSPQPFGRGRRGEEMEGEEKEGEDFADFRKGFKEV
ncbi:uncharacterized protein LOC112341195 [Selaginella moellendorffii]|uniref:uncharacterized protein LOC112341195 n=1 Tax=Selaginella moellendorffii TaxID=88036 RepID=UPI000D1C5EBD|nr:uncharacterized protein LOC112341195 [Selaginella moellendorffii]|eukprot:XP_024516688.1 uncharacterized protein LOC112341195 [Selaginella moellendorffii]